MTMRLSGISRGERTSYSVSVGEREILDFCFSWPCAGLDHLRSVRFTFQGDDLVDIVCRGSFQDGYAMVALSQDAQRYGVERMKKLK